MAYYTWKTGGSGSWGTSADWIGGVPDSATADVTITTAGAYTVTLASGTADTVDSVMLNNGGVEFMLAGTLGLAGSLASYIFDGDEFVLGAAGSLAGGVLDIDSGTLLDDGGHITATQFILGYYGDLALGGKALTLGGTTQLDGGSVYGNSAAGNSLVITGTADINLSMTLEDKATLVVAGTVDQTGTYETYLYLGGGGGDSAVAAINAGGIYDMSGEVYGTAIVAEGAATVLNAGLIDSSYNNAAGYGYGNFISAVVDSTGTIESDLGALQLKGGGTIGGKLSGAGEIDFAAGNFTLAPGLSIGVATLGVEDSSVVTLAGNLSDTHYLYDETSGDIDLNGHSLTLASPFLGYSGEISGPGTVTVTGTTDLTSAFYLTGGATMAVAGTLAAAGNQNSGQAILFLGSGGGDSATLKINAGGVYDLNNASGQFTTSITEQGTGTVINAGLIDSSDGNTGFDTGNGVRAYLISTGTLESDLGALQFYNGGTIAGSLTGAGEIDFNGGNFTLSPSVAVSVATIGILDSAVVTLGGNLDLTDSLYETDGGDIALNFHVLTLTSTNIGYGSGISGGGAVWLEGSSVLAGAFYLSNTATMVVAGTLTAAGNLYSGSQTELYLGAGGADSAYLAITPGGVLDLSNPAGQYTVGIAENGAGLVSNAGLIDSSDGNLSFDTGNGISAALINTGTLESDLGALQLNDGGTIGGTLTGAGEIDFNGGNFTLSPSVAISVATIGILNGAVVTLGSNLDLAGSLYETQGGGFALNGHALTLTSTNIGYGSGFSGPGAVTLLGSSVLAGTFYLTGGATMAVSGTLAAAGNAYSGGQAELYLGANSGDSVTLRINAGDVYAMNNAAGQYHVGISENGSGTVSNAGLIDSSDGNLSFDTGNGISAALINTGTLESDLGALQLNDGGTIGGTLTGAGEIDFNGGNFTLSPAIAISVATIGILNGAEVTLGSNLDLTDSVYETQGGGFDLNGYSLTLTSTNIGYGSGFSGPGAVTLLGSSVLAGTFYLTGGATIALPGTIAASGNVYSGGQAVLYLGADSGDSATLQINAGGAYEMQNAGQYTIGIEDNGGAAGTVLNAGLIETSNTGSGGSNVIAAALISTGTIETDSGSLQLEQGGTVGGTLAGAGEIDFAGGNFTLAPGLALGVAAIGVNNGAVVSLTSNLNDAGYLYDINSSDIALDGHNLTLASPFLGGNAAISGPGNVTLTGTAGLNFQFYVTGGATMVIAGTLDSAPTPETAGEAFLELGASNADSASLVIDAGAEYALSNLYGFADGIEENGSNTVFNAGLIDSSDANLYNDSEVNVIGAVLDSTGTLESDLGQLQLEGGGTLGGKLIGAAEIDLQSGVFNLLPGISITVARLGIGGELVVAGNLSYAGALDLESNGEIYLNGDAVTLSGADALQGYVEASGDLKITSKSALASGLYVGGNALLEDAGTITQAGLVQLGISGPDGGTLAIDAGAVYDLENQGGAGQSLAENGAAVGIYNAGLFELTGFSYPGQSAVVAVNFFNTGSLADNGAGGLALQGNLVNDRLVTVASGDITAEGAVTTDPGTHGTIAIGAGGLFDAAAAVDAGQTIAFGAGGELEIDDLAAFLGTLTGFAAGDVIHLGAGLLANGATYANNILTLTEASNGGAGQVVGALHLVGAAGTFGLEADANGGTDILLNPTGTVFDNPKGVTTLSTWNGTTGNWTTAADWSPAAVPGSLANAFIDTGNNIQISYDTTDTVYQYENSDGGAKLLISGGKLTVDGGGYSDGALQLTAGNFDAATSYDAQGPVYLGSAGTLESDAGVLELSGGGTLAGRIQGSGALELSGAGFLLNAGFNANSISQLIASEANVTLGANVSLGSAQSYALDNFDLNRDNLTLAGASQMDTQGTGDVFDGVGTLSITGTAVMTNVQFNGDVNLADSGTITQYSVDYFGNAASDTSSLLIAAGATYDLADDGAQAGLADSGAGSLVNAGLLEQAGYGGDANYIALPVLNTGTILAAEGDLQLYGGGTLAGKLLGAGEIDLADNTFTAASGLAVSVANFGLISDSTLLLNGTTLALGGNSVLGNYTGYEENVYGAGDLKITGTASLDEFFLEGNKATLEVAGTLDQIAGSALGLDYRSPQTDASALVIDKGGIYDLAGQNEQILWGGGSQSMVNAGLLETSGIFVGGSDQIYTPFDNTGTVLVNVGDLQFGGGGTLAGTLAGSGEIDLTGGSFLLNSLTASIAVLNASGGNLTLGANISTASDVIAQAGTIFLNGHNLTLAGSAVLDDTVYGPGTLKVTGNAVIATSGYNVDLFGAELEDAGTLSPGSNDVALAPNGTAQAGIVIDAGASFDVTTYTEINGPGFFLNKGALAVDSPGGEYIGTAVTNASTGTIAIEAGDLQLAGGGTIGGTLGGAGEIDFSAGYVSFASGLVADTAILSVESTIAVGGTLTFGGALIVDGGTIQGGQEGVLLQGPTGTIENTGLIEGGSATVTYSATHQVSSVGAILDNGGYLHNASGASVIGNQAGVVLAGSLAVPMEVENSGVILGAANAASFIGSAYASFVSTYASTGLVLVDGGTVTNTDTGRISGFEAGLLDAGSAGAGISIYNSGLIEATGNTVNSNSTVNACTGVVFEIGGNLTNAVGGVILGYGAGFAANTSFGAGVSVDNAGLIEATGTSFPFNSTIVGDSVGLVSTVGGSVTNEASGTLIGWGDGVVLNGVPGGLASLDNRGLILATGTTLVSNGVTSSAVGAVLGGGGMLVNEASGLISGHYGVYLGGGSSAIAGDLSNAGAIYGADLGVILGPDASASNAGQITAGRIAVLINANDSFANQPDGTVSAGYFGVLAYNGTAANVVNEGLVTATSFGILLTNGPGTVLNAGTIASSTADAVALAAGFSNRVIVDPGAVFIGNVDGGDALGASASSVLELAAGNGTMSGIGGQFIDFQTIALDGHASWAVSGNLVGETIAFAGAQAKLILDQPGAIPATLAGLGAGDIIDIAASTVKAASFGGTNLFITLSGGAVLDETLASTIAGERFAITSDGSTGSDLTLYREAAASITPNPLAFGNHHVGDTVSAGLTLANTQMPDGYSENLDASFTSHAGGITAAGSLSLLGANATNSSALTIGLITSTPGSIAGTAAIALASDGAGTDADAPVSLGSQTIAVTGGVYAYAAPQLAAATIALGNAHVGAADTAALTLSNTGTSLAFTEALDASFSGNAGAVSAFGTLARLGAGATNATSLAVGLFTTAAGTLSGTTTLDLASDGTLIDGLGTTALAARTITVTGAVFNYATAAGLPGTLALGQHHAGFAVTDTLTLSNAAAAGFYSEKLDASFSGTALTAGSFATAGSVTTLAAGATNASALEVKLVSSTAGSIAGEAFITLTSDGAGIDTLGTTGLGLETIAVTGAVFNYATAAVNVTTLALGEHHAGALGSSTLTVKNSAAPGAYSEKLDARFSGTSFTAGSFTTNGTIALLAAGSSSSALGVTLAGTAGVVAGKVTLGLTSDGTGVNTLASSALSAQTIAVTGTLYNYATAALPATLALGQHHVGDIVTGDITLANSAAAGVYSEALDATLSGTTLTHGSFAAGGAISLLAAGATNASSLAVSLATGTAGTVAGVVTLALKSDGTGIDTLGATALAAKTEAVTGTLFAYAAPTLASTLLNFGIVHAGAPVTETLSLSNGTASPYTESLDAAFLGASGITATGTITHLAAGAASNSGLTLGLSGTQAGGIFGTATLGLASDGAGIDTLGVTGLASDTVTLTGSIVNYATAALEERAGAGSLTATGANSYVLALGTLQQGIGSLAASLAVLNSAAGPSDTLAGSFVIGSAGAFVDNGFGSFSGLGAGQSDVSPAITLSSATAGVFSELITLSSAGSNASGYKGALANITLDVTGDVLHTYTLTTGADTLNGAGNDLIIAKTGQLSAGDIINAGTGTNILTLAGGGTFNMAAPATLTGVQIVQAQENVGTAAQTLYLDAGFAGTVDAGSGPAGSSLTVYGNLDSATINLGAGNDLVYVGSSLEDINGGGGNDVFFLSSGDAGATIDGGAGINTLAVAGGTRFAMGANITSISSVVINESATQSETFVANGIAGLAITGGSGNDTITLGAASQSVLTGTGNTVIDATAAQAGAAITTEGSATLDVTTGGNATLNAEDDFLTVSLASATNLTLSSMSFITAIGSSGNDTITALAAEQTLTGGLGVDTLIGYAGFGDMFQDTEAGLNTDTIKYFGGNDLIDLTNLARAGASLSYFGSATSGTLSVDSGGALVSTITLTSGSNLAQSMFHLTSDGHGGTNIALI